MSRDKKFSSSEDTTSDELTILQWLEAQWCSFISFSWLRRSSNKTLDKEQCVNHLPEQNETRVDIDRESSGVVNEDDEKIELNNKNITLILKIPSDTDTTAVIETNLTGDQFKEVNVKYQTRNKEDLAVELVNIPTTIHCKVEKVEKLSMGKESVKTDYSRVLNKVRSLVNIQESYLGITLFILSLGVYLLTRLIGLEDFPIYFFTDEAIHTVLAENLVQNGFHFQGELLPTYFSVGSTFGLNSATVYLQVLPFLLFGKSVYVTRLVAVLFTFIGAIAIGLTVRDYFKSPYWWVSTLLLSVTPTWFLHSRTAFENVAVASFYACFLYFYLGYRLRSPKLLYPAILFGGLTFYSHGLGQFLMAFTGLFFFFIDLRYHWAQRKIFIIGTLLVILVLIPYFRFTINSPHLFEEQLRQRASYWTDNSLMAFEKIAQFFKQYVSGFNPFYWFNPQQNKDLVRHVMKGYGHFLLPSLIFIIWGLIISFRQIRRPEYRILLITLLVAPIGAATAEVTILRTIWIVVPVTILATLGLSSFLVSIEGKISRKVISIATFVILAGLNIYMLSDALINGPLWYKDYTLYGMQYGSKQVFGEAIPELLASNPNAYIVVTPSWANGTDNFKQFFLSSEQQARVSFNSISAYLYERLAVDKNIILVLTRDEYQIALNDPKIGNISVNKIVDYPDGNPGFYFVNIDYAENADEIFMMEKEARQQLIQSTVNYFGQKVLIEHSMLDMGEPSAIFDSDVYTLMRGLEANPLIIDMFFEVPTKVSGIVADFANMDFTINAKLYTESDSVPIEYSNTWQGISGDPHIEMIFQEAPDLIARLRLEVYSNSHGERAHIHVRELELLQK